VLRPSNSVGVLSARILVDHRCWYPIRAIATRICYFQVAQVAASLGPTHRFFPAGLRLCSSRSRRKEIVFTLGLHRPPNVQMLLYGQRQPLNRQAKRYALEGVPIALSTMADAVGSVCTSLDPLLRLVEAHVMAAERLQADDTTVPVLARTYHGAIDREATVACREAASGRGG
jgi:Transposase IS66 family